jgi:hypothetical protein
VVLAKTASSAFFDTPLMSHLHGLGIDTLIVGGESTSGCVRASVVDAASYRFRTIVVEECVYDRHEAAHAINLFDMDQKYADVIATDAVLSYLETLQEGIFEDRYPPARLRSEERALLRFWVIDSNILEANLADPGRKTPPGRSKRRF